MSNFACFILCLVRTKLILQCRSRWGGEGGPLHSIVNSSLTDLTLHYRVSSNVKKLNSLNREFPVLEADSFVCSPEIFRIP
jgi:hypothetical protein